MNKEEIEIIKEYLYDDEGILRDFRYCYTCGSTKEFISITEKLLKQASLVDTLKEKILEEIDICKQAIKICEITRECHYNLDNRLEFLNAWLKISEGN